MASRAMHARVPSDLLRHSRRKSFGHISEPSDLIDPSDNASLSVLLQLHLARLHRRAPLPSIFGPLGEKHRAFRLWCPIRLHQPDDDLERRGQLGGTAVSTMIQIVHLLRYRRGYNDPIR
jgi:hypothetical protein